MAAKMNAVNPMGLTDEQFYALMQMQNLSDMEKEQAGLEASAKSLREGKTIIGKHAGWTEALKGIGGALKEYHALQLADELRKERKRVDDIWAERNLPKKEPLSPDTGAPLDRSFKPNALGGVGNGETVGAAPDAPVAAPTGMRSLPMAANAGVPIGVVGDTSESAGLPASSGLVDGNIGLDDWLRKKKGLFGDTPDSGFGGDYGANYGSAMGDYGSFGNLGNYG